MSAGPPHGLGQALAFITVVLLTAFGIDLAPDPGSAQVFSGLLTTALAIVYAFASRRLWPGDVDGDGVDDDSPGR